MNPNEKSQKVANIFSCFFCNYTTCKKSDYTKHAATDKHKILTNPNIKVAKVAEFICNCGKSYKHSSSLSAHKKKCTDNIFNNVDNNNINNVSNNGNNNIVSDKDDLITYLVKENQDFKNLILEIIKKDTYNQSITNNNSHNKTFNLQFFLNETCKDAMNIMEFVDSIKLQLSDLENVGKIGYVDGISNIITKNLNNLDIEKRPVHCTDSKREVIYVKDDNQWYNDSKDHNENNKIKKAIKHIAYKNTKLLQEFKAKYPDCIYSDSKKSDQYNKIVIEAFGGSNETDNENKIIKKIAKEVIIDK